MQNSKFWENGIIVLGRPGGIPIAPTTWGTKEIDRTEFLLSWSWQLEWKRQTCKQIVTISNGKFKESQKVKMP
jgi:hypothetical protein